MKPFRAYVDLRPKLPNDRLYTIEVGDGVITNVWRIGHLSEHVRRDMEEYMRHILRYGWLQDERGRPHYTEGTHKLVEGSAPPDEAGHLEIHMDRVSEAVLGAQPVTFKIVGESFIWVVQQDLVSIEAVKEFDQAVDEFDAQYDRWERKPSGLIVPNLDDFD